MQIPRTTVALSPDYDGSIRIAVSLGAWERATDGDSLMELVENLFVLADRGAFVREDAEPADAALRVERTAHSPPSRYTWDVLARHLDHRFVQVFRNQMVMFSAVYCPVEQVHVEMLAHGRARADLLLPPIDAVAAARGDNYPPRSHRLPFDISVEEISDYRRARRAEIELVAPISDDMLGTFRDWFDLWLTSLDCGYASSEDALTSGRCAIYDGGTEILDEITVETRIEMWGAPECTWASYLNLVGRADRELARVAAVRVY
jgi:hypothetical protein